MTDDEQGEYEDTITRLTAELEEANNDIDMVMADYQDLGRLMCEDESVKEITRLREDRDRWIADYKNQGNELTRLTAENKVMRELLRLILHDDEVFLSPGHVKEACALLGGE